MESTLNATLGTLLDSTGMREKVCVYIYMSYMRQSLLLCTCTVPIDETEADSDNRSSRRKFSF